MAEVCMENFDQNFADIARSGDVLVSGFNFGCGSSREQAATAILAKKIPMVVAGRYVFSESIFLLLDQSLSLETRLGSSCSVDMF